MKLKKPLAVAGVTAGVAIASLSGAASVMAATGNSTSTTTSTNPESSLIDKLVSKFGLKKADVQAVFDEEHAAREAEQTTRVETELTQLVTDGKITAAQKTAILDKRAELEKQRQANRDSMSTKTDDERKATMDAERTALETWAKDNGLSTDYLRYVMGGPGGHRGFGGPGEMGPPPSQTSN